MIPDILNIIWRFVGKPEFESLDDYANVVREFNMIYSPEVVDYLWSLKLNATYAAPT